MRVKVVKNKLAPPFRFTEFDIIFGEGISQMGDLLDLGCNFEIVEKSGTWFSCNNERLGQGREAAKQYLAEHESLVAYVHENIKKKVDEIKQKITEKGNVSKQKTKEKVSG